MSQMAQQFTKREKEKDRGKNGGKVINAWHKYEQMSCSLIWGTDEISIDIKLVNFALNVIGLMT